MLILCKIFILQNPLQPLSRYLASPSETVFVQTRSFPEIFVMKIKSIINKALFMIWLAVTVTRPAYFQNQIPRYRIPLILNSIEFLHSFRRVLGKSIFECTSISSQFLLMLTNTMKVSNFVLVCIMIKTNFDQFPMI